jgi:diguanylate cyclase (GGDEF)-like protein
MLLPLIAVSLISINVLQHTISTANEIVEDSVNEMHLAMSLQLAITDAAMPPNDYIIHGRSDEQTNARKANAMVEQVFSRISTSPSWTPEQRKIVAEARQEWIKSRHLGEAIMQLKNPVGLPQAPDMMEQYDAQLERTNSVVAQLHHIAMREVAKNHEELHNIESKFITIMLSTVLVGLLLSISGSILMIRATFPALKHLKQGIELFGKGHLDYRIGADMPPELQNVSEGLNAMATKLQTIHTRLEQQSMQDGLTGAFNKRKFTIDFKHEIDRARRYGQTFSLLMIDLDHFKIVNDTYGHPAGDTVLQTAVKKIAAQLRTSDTLYRYGGEEFTVLLPVTDETSALIAAERIRSSMADDHILLSNNKEVTVKISIGAATYPQHGNQEDELLTAADEALYTAKNSGRNRVCASKTVTG